MSSRTIDERVATIEKVFWVVAALAVIFGVSGAWGYKLLSDARDEIAQLRPQIAAERAKVEELRAALVPIEEFVSRSRDEVEAARKQIAAATKKELLGLQPQIQGLVAEAARERLSGRAAVASTPRHITTLGTHTPVSVRARKGDLIVATFSGSAERGEFYYRIVPLENSAVSLTNSSQVIMVSSSRWQSLSATQVFRADRDREVKLAIEFYKSDVSGVVKVFGSTLAATVVAADG